MARKKYKRNEIVEADLTPMIDVTFQLIAFFMFLINFSEIDRAEEILLPSSKLAKPPIVRPDYKMILNLEPNGEVEFSGQRIPQISLMGAIFSEEISRATSQKVPVNEISVIIRAHKKTPTGLVQKLIAKCQESKLESFSLRVKEKIR